VQGREMDVRKLPGTIIASPSTRRAIYTPPQGETVVREKLANWADFIHNSDEIDPLVRMAVAHYQFEAIHPFDDGNGRTGRIINVLYLVKKGLLEIPVLYLSRHIVRTKSDYYRLLQEVRERDAWEDWVLYMLEAIEQTAAAGIETIQAIKGLFLDYKHRIRAQYKFYSQDLINNLFSHPYTKIEFIQKDLEVSRLTATKYLDQLTQGGFLQKQKIGRSNYYINKPLYAILTGDAMRVGESQRR
jgi:Fic family protein